MTNEIVQLSPLSASVVLDGSGNGTVRFAPVGATWFIDRIAVKVSTRVLEATAYMYQGFIGDQYLISNTLTGSTGDTSTGDNIMLTDGQALYVVWSGGDAGATATAIVSGRQTVTQRGFRAIS